MVGAEQGNFESFESLDRWKWHFQSLFYLFGIMICESMLFVIIEIRTLDIVFKFKNFFDAPFLWVKTFLTPLFIKVKLRLPPSHLPTPLPINNDHSLSYQLLVCFQSGEKLTAVYGVWCDTPYNQSINQCLID
jgi:hypothetical protein